MATAQARLTGVIRIHFHAERAGQDRLVGEQALQLGEGPLRGVPIGLARFGRDRHQLFALAAILATFCAVSNARQVFQADKCAGVGVQDLLTDHMVGIQLQPSLSLAQPDTGGAWRYECLSAEVVFAGERNGPPWRVPPFRCRTGRRW